MEYEICGRTDLSLESDTSGAGESETDLPPEFCHYQDEGCELAASCLNCPFPQCMFDKPGGRQHWLKERRDSEITRLSRKGIIVKELATRFGISQRTIQRALKRALEKAEHVAPERLKEGDLADNE